MQPSPRRRTRRALAAVVLAIVALVLGADGAAAQVDEPPVTTPPRVAQQAPEAAVETGAVTPGGAGAAGAAGATGAVGSGSSITLSIPGAEEPSQSVLIIVLLTLLSVAPALLVLLTSFTRIAIVLSLTRNALGLQGVPPNQVIIGLAMFLSFFVMAPVLTQMNEEALQPMLDGEIDQGEAYDRAVVPLRGFMLEQVGDDELELFLSQTSDERPEGPEDVPMAALVPAFVLSELKTAFLIGFVVFVPFLVIDLIVSSSLMSLGMMMMPPTLVSLPFKILLFVLVDGWGLIIKSLLESF
jgi:flagellar biosynthetic protein FliP